MARQGPSSKTCLVERLRAEGAEVCLPVIDDAPYFLVHRILNCDNQCTLVEGVQVERTRKVLKST